MEIYAAVVSTMALVLSIYVFFFRLELSVKNKNDIRKLKAMTAALVINQRKLVQRENSRLENDPIDYPENFN